MITASLTESGNRKLLPLPDSDQHFRLQLGANLVEAQSIDLTFQPCEYDNQVMFAYGQDNHFGFLFEIWDFNVRVNLGQESPQISECAYSDGWEPEKGNFFWVIMNTVQDPMIVGTAPTIMLALAGLFYDLDTKYCVH